MHEQNPVREKQALGTLTHNKAVIQADSLDKSGQEGSSSTAAFTTQTKLQSLYPDPTRHIPGNSDTAGLERLNEQVAVPAKVVHKRVQSLFFYAFGVVIFGTISIGTLLANHIAFKEGSRPISLEIVGYPVAIIPIIGSAVLFAAKSTRVVTVTLSLNFLAYLAMALVTYVLIITNFADFFTGIGAVGVAHTFFLFWTRQNLKEVNDLPLTSTEQ